MERIWDHSDLMSIIALVDVNSNLVSTCDSMDRVAPDYAKKGLTALTLDTDLSNAGPWDPATRTFLAPPPPYVAGMRVRIFAQILVDQMLPGGNNWAALTLGQKLAWAMAVKNIFDATGVATP